MKVKTLAKLIQARIMANENLIDHEVFKAFSSDLMSDVLTLDVENILLISGLANIQLIRTAEMADIKVLVLARNKKANQGMVKLANESHIIVLESPFSIFKCSGILYENGIKPLY